ncbi:MAG: MATE family efflux transporter [Muribaculaceae bacterium]|nr:MATE family efflux transporter [Muribaculaceae bacterium]
MDLNINLNKEILRLAAPAIINNITVPLLGLCDTAIAGHLGAASYLGAIAVGSMMLNVFFWLAGFLRMGTTGLTARSLGRGSIRQCKEVLRKSMMMVCIISIVVIMARSPLLDTLLYLIKPSEDSARLAGLYFSIGVWWVPAQLIIMTVSGWFIGLQSTVVPMTIAIFTNVINIVLSILFAFVLHKGFEGIAFGTLCANWIGALAAIIWALSRYRRLENRFTNTISNGAGKNREEKNESGPGHGNYIGETRIRWRELFSVNGALFVRSACIMAVTLTVTSVGARLGELTLAANAVIMQFFFFFSYFMDGFAFSGEALVGKFNGMRRPDMVVKTMSALCKWGGGMALVFFIIYLFGNREITSLLTDTEIVRQEIEHFRIWILLLPPVTVSAFIFDGIFVGLTRTRDMMWVTIAGAFSFFTILFITGLEMNNNLLWGAFETYLFIRGAALAAIFVNYFKKEVRN